MFFLMSLVLKGSAKLLPVRKPIEVSLQSAAWLALATVASAARVSRANRSLCCMVFLLVGCGSGGYFESESVLSNIHATFEAVRVHGDRGRSWRGRPAT